LHISALGNQTAPDESCIGHFLPDNYIIYQDFINAIVGFVNKVNREKYPHSSFSIDEESKQDNEYWYDFYKIAYAKFITTSTEEEKKNSSELHKRKLLTWGKK
jgi:hypothetical protein